MPDIESLSSTGTAIDHYKIDQQFQFGEETAAGTAVAALQRTNAALNMVLADDGSITPVWADGAAFGMAGVQAAMFDGKFTFGGQACFNTLPFILNGLFGKASPSAAGAGYLRTYTPPLRAVPRGQSYTFQKGDSWLARQMARATFGDFAFKHTPKEVTVSGGGIGRGLTDSTSLSLNTLYTIAVTGETGVTTFTITKGGQTTGALALTSGQTAAAITTALEALSTIGVDNVRVKIVSNVAGPPRVLTFTVELTNALGQASQTLTGATTGGTGSPGVVLTRTTNGAAPTDIPAQVLDPNGGQIQLADSVIGLGTPILRVFELNLGFAGLRQAIHPIGDNTQGFAGVGGKRPTHSGTIILGIDTEGSGLRTTMKTGAVKYLRYFNQGPAIDGSHYYTLQIDLAIQITSVPTPQEVEELELYSYGFTPYNDVAGTGWPVRYICTNTVAAYT
jgi:hypothetical protein